MRQSFPSEPWWPYIAQGAQQTANTIFGLAPIIAFVSKSIGFIPFGIFSFSADIFFGSNTILKSVLYIHNSLNYSLNDPQKNAQKKEKEAWSP